MPERYRIAGGELDVVFDDESVRDAPDLFLPFPAPSDLERKAVDHKVGDGRGDYIVTHPHLVEEEGFPDIADFGSLSPEIVYQVRIVEVYLIHFSQSAYSARVVAKLRDKSRLLDVETIIGHAVAAHAQCLPMPQRRLTNRREWNLYQ